jgi:N-acetyl-gamma-glutamyl-phosphate reductase
MIRAGILGATGYTGHELLRIFHQHPLVETAFVSSSSYAGQCYSQVYPCPYDDVLVAPEQAPLDQADVVFLCTPHHASAELARNVLQAGGKCVDLSADFRLRSAAVYREWYGEHQAPELLDRAVYGLTEVYRAAIAQADLVANPGCYPTGPLLALQPLLLQGALAAPRIIIDAASGVSGAGAQPSPTTHFVNVHDNYSAYKVGHSHRHVPEIEQELRAYGGAAIRLTFTPHLLPVARGILSTIYLSVAPSWTPERLVALWHETYARSPFVQVLTGDSLATLAHVVGTNRCALSVTSAGQPGELIVITAIDNLIKGASGQAVQNMNVMFGVHETLGLIG